MGWGIARAGSWADSCITASASATSGHKIVCRASSMRIPTGFIGDCPLTIIHQTREQSGIMTDTTSTLDPTTELAQETAAAIQAAFAGFREAFQAITRKA